MKNKNKIDTSWFFNKTYYLRHSNKICYSLRVLKYDIFSWKALFIKSIIFLCCCIILIPTSLHLENWALSLTYNQTQKQSNSIIGIQPIGNPGIEFSFLSNTPVWVVFFSESITIFLATLCLIISSYKPWLIVPISFCLIGGIMNLDSRASLHEYVPGSYYYERHIMDLLDKNYKNYGVVIDYWHFYTGNNYVIFNFNDTLVISGAIGYILFIFITFIYIYFASFIL